MDFNLSVNNKSEQTPNYRFCTKAQEDLNMGQLFPLQLYPFT